MSNWGVEVRDSNGVIVANSNGVFNIATLLGTLPFNSNVAPSTGINFEVVAQNGIEVYETSLNAGGDQSITFTLERSATVCVIASLSCTFGNGNTNYEAEAACKALVWPALVSEEYTRVPDAAYCAVVMGDNGLVIDSYVVNTPTVFRFVNLPAGENTAVVNAMTPPQQYAASNQSVLSVAGSLQIVRFGF